MFEKDAVEWYNLDIYFCEHRYFAVIKSRKTGCIFFKICNRPSHVFIHFVKVMIRLYLKCLEKKKMKF